MSILPVAGEYIPYTSGQRPDRPRGAGISARFGLCAPARVVRVAAGAHKPLQRARAVRHGDRGRRRIDSLDGARLDDVVNSTIDDVVDTERYLGAGRAGTVARVRRELAEAGCSVLRDFVPPERRETLRAQGAEIAPCAYYDVETVNVYNTDPDPSLPADHPAARTMERGNAFVARDVIPPDAIIARLYMSAAFQRFLADCFGRPRVHELADPLSGLTLNVVNPGRSHPWHFDTNELTVSMLTQAPDGGGEFEFCPNIRSAEQENIDDVRAVLDGRGGPLTRRLTLAPGDLQLCRGRYALHRVTPVRGNTPRHSAIFAYSGRPGVLGTVSRTRQLFGRVTSAHLDAEGRVRVDQLMD